MTAISLLLLAATAIAAGAGYAAMRAMRDLGRRLDECPHAAHGDATVPQARTAEDIRSEEIRTIVAEAMAEERERELAEARAAWSTQESGSAEEEDATLAGCGTEYEVAPVVDALLKGRVDDDTLRELRELRDRDLPQAGIFVPRQLDRDLGRQVRDLDARAERSEAPADRHETAERPEAAERPEVAAARRRHPSEPDFTLTGEPVASATQPPPVTEGREEAVERLTELAKARTPLSDVRQGPLGTLDVYLFADGTTVCLSPGHRETAEALCTALRDGDTPVLMGGSTVSGAYGEGHTAYLLADRVIASR